MSKKKHGSGGHKPTPSAPSKNAPQPKNTKNNKTGYILGTVALLVVALMVVLSNLGTSNTAAAPGQAAGAGAPQAPPEELAYIGRFLPAGYVESAVASATTYTSTIKMTNVTAALGDKQVTLPVSDVVTNKIVFFEYQKPGAEAVPLAAYLKPTGRLLVAVSYCIPCKGTGQRIEADGTLTCETCGTKRDLETMVGISGACRLYPLDEIAATVSGGQIVIERSALDTWTPQPRDRQVG